MNMSENSYQKAGSLLTESFDAVSYIEDEFFKGVEPDSYMSVSDWADEYRILSSKSASEPGRWRTARTPYLREIMDCLSPKSPIQKVVFMKGAQIGGTECGNNWLGYIMHKAPGPIMAVSPTVEMAKRNSRQRIDPLIEDCTALKNLVSSPRSRDKGNTMLSKDFQGGVLVMTVQTRRWGFVLCRRGICLWMRLTATHKILTMKVIRFCWQNGELLHLISARRYFWFQRQQ